VGGGEPQPPCAKPFLLLPLLSTPGQGSPINKNAICSAKNEFSKVNYLKNLFQYNSVVARIQDLSGQAAA